MTRATDALRAGREAMAEHFPTTADYTAIDGTVTAGITVVAGRELDEHGRDDMAGLDRRRRRRLRCTILGSNVTTPVREATLTISTGNLAGTWVIEQVRPLAAADHDVTAVLRTTTNTSDPESGAPRGLG